MVNKCRIQAICLLLLMGCNLMPSQQQQTRYVDPVLSMSLTCEQLTEHLNRHCRGLQAWKCIDTTVTVRMPNGIPHKLSGNIACQAPRNFRLSASSVVAHADLGSNAERCWIYIQPGDGQVLTWRHEDAALLQYVAVGVPQIDPDWLMAVLGVVPLDPADFEVSSGPAGARELWLTAVTDDYEGRPLRRVIKVDTVTGLPREHVIYNSEREPLIRATLKEHTSCQGYLLPRTVNLEFPELDTELTLRFNKIETNCQLPTALWTVPEKRNVRVTDLGDLVRARGPQTPSSLPRHMLQHAAPAATPTDSGHSTFSSVQPVSEHFDSQAPPEFDQEAPADHRLTQHDPQAVPNWDTPPTGSSAPALTSRPRQQTPARRGFFSWLRR